jgi:uncharacterized protein (TIGR02118 family)
MSNFNAELAASRRRDDNPWDYNLSHHHRSSIHAKEQQMIKFNVIYPLTPGMRFDHDYYRDSHMPMLAQRLGKACLYYTIDKGLAGGAPGAPSPFAAACSVYADSVETLQAAMNPHVQEIMADIPRYTDVHPVIWISDVVVERS